MALKKTLAQRLFNITRRLSTPISAVRRIPPSHAHDPGDDVISRRFQSTAQEFTPATSTTLMHRLRGMDITGNRLRFDGLISPTMAEVTKNITLEDTRKVLRVSQLENIKTKIRNIRKDSILFEEFLDICSEGCGSRELGVGFANMLDESGHVIVLGKLVFLRPEKVVKIVQGLMPSPVSQPNDLRWKEFEEMEKQKSLIDQKAEFQVRRELWCGLGYLIMQTAVFMRLTFWELTWDVMEPICFYVTSGYFMAGYAFFLRTKIEPSFEGLFLSRFSTKQKQLMKKADFDVERYKELSRAFYPRTSTLHGNAPLPVVPSYNL